MLILRKLASQLTCLIRKAAVAAPIRLSNTPQPKPMVVPCTNRHSHWDFELDSNALHPTTFDRFRMVALHRRAYSCQEQQPLLARWRCDTYQERHTIDNV
ncbi:hypothetical protein IAQ61_001798 [Plenodomus lingam]|uniref:uncharacterized protein n=1 Tax=Leptosphaeria maculans TaxID=5022 RepID=UPI00331A948B|nr:hypothetical protein IAQ61_001798 [Plenodomus lingam]